jgi:hypothetical protein
MARTAAQCIPTIDHLSTGIFARLSIKLANENQNPGPTQTHVRLDSQVAGT